MSRPRPLWCQRTNVPVSTPCKAERISSALPGPYVFAISSALSSAGLLFDAVAAWLGGTSSRRPTAIKNRTAAGTPMSTATALKGLGTLSAAMTATITTVTTAAGTPTSSNSRSTHLRSPGSLSGSLWKRSGGSGLLATHSALLGAPHGTRLLGRSPAILMRSFSTSCTFL